MSEDPGEAVSPRLLVALEGRALLRLLQVQAVLAELHLQSLPLVIEGLGVNGQVLGTANALEHLHPALDGVGNQGLIHIENNGLDFGQILSPYTRGLMWLGVLRGCLFRPGTP